MATTSPLNHRASVIDFRCEDNIRLEEVASVLYSKSQQLHKETVSPSTSPCGVKHMAYRDRRTMRRPRDNDEGWTDLKGRISALFKTIQGYIFNWHKKHIIEITRWEDSV